jgi:hypothetical protein
MNRRRFQQLLLSLGVTGLCACTGMQQAKANSDFEGAVWKSFEYKALGKVVQFEFPVNVPGTTTTKFDPSQISSGKNHLIITLRTDESVGWVHATSGINIHILISRELRLEDKLHTLFFEFRDVNDLFNIITEKYKSNSLKSYKHTLDKVDNRQWIKSVSFWSHDGSHDDESYSTVLNNDYLISVSFGLGTRGKPDETRLAELRKVGERIVASVHIE